ncbi:MAG: succinate dehydrogenase cytochrome b subunit [Ignavibacteriales bacterium]|nr:succinate dehydrogenase cytochrome b subunit [Ignavibacteriales bacterium]
MNAFFAFINSSVGKKILMSLTGIFLCTFLVEHLAGNLLLLKKDGGEAFDAYAHFMGGNPIVRTLEIGLFAIILIHIINGTFIWFSNRRARDKRYASYKLEENTTFQSRMMAVSASLVFVFLVVHLAKFWVPARILGEQNLSSLVYATFRQTFFVVFYLVALVVLSYHLRHGFQSAFQTLGWKTKRYGGLIEFIAVLFWLVIPIGFAIIPLYIYFYGGSAVAMMR